MGNRYLKVEDEAIRKYYPTATRQEILQRIPNRTWIQIGARAIRIGVHRSTQAKGDSIREGRKALENSWEDDKDMFLALFPVATRAQILKAFPRRTWLSIQSYAGRLHLHRSREAIGRQISIGRGKR